MEDFSGREKYDDGHEAWIAAVHELAEAIVKDDEQVKRLYQQLAYETYGREKLRDELMQRKADLITLYTQVHLRGGVN